MHQTYLLLGANLGNPQEQLQFAKKEITQRIGQVIKASKIYSSQAWGVENQPDFLNQVLLVETPMSAKRVLQEINRIEMLLGRIRGQRWGARIIDIDILYYDQEIIHEPDLQIPHPYIQERNFTLIPLSEIAAEFEHPVFKKDNQTLLAESKDPLTVKAL